MICVGIDVSKRKSTVCFMAPGDKIIRRPFDVKHTKEELQPLVDEIRVQAKYDEIKVVMESTGVYHLSIAYFLQQNGIFVSVANALKVANFNKAENFRHTKTDSIDSTNIARYGIAYWAKLPQFDLNGDKYFLLKRLCDAYLNFSEERSRILLQLQSQLEQTMPGIFDLFGGFDINSGKDKLLDFLERYCHIEDIIAKPEAEFVASYCGWAKEKGYRSNESKAATIYAQAKNGIPSIPNNPIVRETIMWYVKLLRRADEALMASLTRMEDIAKDLPEYELVGEMGGVGRVTRVALIAQIGDVRRFKNKHSLICFAGLTPSIHESGKFRASQNHIVKKGPARLRKVLYQVMMSLVMHKIPKDDAVYRFIKKKEAEGKYKKVAKVAGMAKFLRIYYGRVMHLYRDLGLAA